MVDKSYVISVDEEKQLVHLVVKGEFDKSEGEKIIIDARTKAAENNLNILCDVTDALFKVTMADWFYLARNKEIYPSLPSNKTAILINPNARKVYKFVEDVTRNVGMKIRVFLNKDDAIEWLKGQGNQ